MDSVIECSLTSRPHLVILGAGASLATLPNGDKNGRQLPLMRNLIEILNLKNITDNPDKNFEEIYSDLHKKNSPHLASIEKDIRDYFSDIEIPEELTIYDYLIISLREKDYIASFNWDPLLLQAYQRMSRITQNLPRLLFLHGNVLVGFCENCNNCGLLTNYCSKCQNSFSPSKLLFPIKEKNYAQNIFIKAQWNEVKNALRNAYVVTIFGYSAPNSDQEAMKLFQEGWGENTSRALEEFEFIVRDKSKENDAWESFVHSHHSRIEDSFWDSLIAQFPRRSCEAIFEMYMQCRFIDPHPVSQNTSQNQLEELITSLIQHEEATDTRYSLNIKETQ